MVILTGSFTAVLRDWCGSRTTGPVVGGERVRPEDTRVNGRTVVELHRRRLPSDGEAPAGARPRRGPNHRASTRPKRPSRPVSGGGAALRVLQPDEVVLTSGRHREQVGILDDDEPMA